MKVIRLDERYAVTVAGHCLDRVPVPEPGHPLHIQIPYPLGGGVSMVATFRTGLVADAGANGQAVYETVVVLDERSPDPAYLPGWEPIDNETGKTAK